MDVACPPLELLANRCQILFNVSMCFALMFSYGAELPSYIGLMERHILLLSVKAQGIVSAKVLRLSPPWPACHGPLLEMLDEMNLAPGSSFTC